MSKKPHIETGMGVRKHKLKAEEVNLHMTIYDGNRKSLEAYGHLMGEFQKIALRELQIPMKMVKSWEALNTPAPEKKPAAKAAPKKKKDSERSVLHKETKE